MSSAAKSNSLWKYTFIRLRRNYLALLGFTVLAVLVVTAIFADQIAPYGYAKQDYMMIRKAPSAQHLLGTDEFGRDVLSRLIYGSRVSLQVGLVAVAISLIAGGAIGAISGYFGGRIDNILMRIMDVQLAIPTILLAIVISSALGPGMFNLMVAVGITSIPRFARLMRASVLSLKGMEFIEAARAMGASHTRIILLYILPNCMAPLIVQSTLSVANAILFAATSLAAFVCSGLFNSLFSLSELQNLNGSSNNPNSNFIYRIRLTASSTKAIGTLFSLTNFNITNE